MCLHIELPWALATPAGTLRCNSKVGYASKDTVKGSAAGGKGSAGHPVVEPTSNSKLQQASKQAASVQAEASQASTSQQCT
jgi:hypothetical protein